MFDLDLFLKELDNVYSQGAEAIGEYLLSGVNTAKEQGDKGATLVILNELMGLYRVMNEFEKCTQCADEVLELSKELGIEDTANFGTVLLNVATAYRVMGRYDEAEKYYAQVGRIFEKTLDNSDYRMATLHNNLSLLYSETDRLPQAKEQLMLAMEIILQLTDAEVEIAITHTNLGNLCFKLHQNDEGIEHMKKAVMIFEKSNATDDSHYASALSGLAEAYFYLGELEDSVKTYEKALTEINRHYGENDYYKVVSENLSIVRDTLERRNSVLNSDLNGMKISKMYYEKYGEPLLKEKYNQYLDNITVGLVGEGSECFGFDDEYSTDHDFGPSFCIWLDSELYNKIGQELAEDYDSLPKTFMGFKARNTISTGVGRVGVLETNKFYENILGCPVPESETQWHTVPQEFLATATNGEIFKEGSGDFLKIREKISYYPSCIRIQKLAIALGQMAQTGQVNYLRMLRRQDIGSAQLCINEFVKATIECVYIINSKYAPYYKWQFKGMDELELLNGIKPLLLKIMDMKTDDTSVTQTIEQICGIIADELLRQGLSHSNDTFLENQKNEVLKNING